MNKIILITHSTLARGLYEGIKFFKDDITNVAYINAYVDDSNAEEEFLKKVEESKEHNIIICTDIKGGSVNQIAFKHLNQYKYHLISGVNLPLLLEIVFRNDDLSGDDISSIVNGAKEELVYLNQMISQEKGEEYD